MDEQRHDDQPEPIYNSSVLIQHISLKISGEQWTIEAGSDDDDDDDDDDNWEFPKYYFIA